MRSENQKIKQRLEIINKRIGFLKTRVSENPTRDMSYDKHEFTALEWMLKSNEELRGKLKIAEDALVKLDNSVWDYNVGATARRALKQIRGE